MGMGWLMRRGGVAVGLAGLGLMALASAPAWAATTGSPTLSGEASPCVTGPAPNPTSQPPGVCSAEPTAVKATWSDPTVQSLSLSWVTTGRPKGAPAPPSGTVSLNPKAPGACTTTSGKTSCSWPWPTALERNHAVLNGTYQLTPCLSGPGTGCLASPLLAPASIAIAAPPSQPTGVVVSSVGGADPAALVAWTANPEPDLTGYQVERDGHVVWSCVTGTAPAAGQPAVTCPAPPSMTDHPGVGVWAYSVIARRYGAAGDALVSSPAATVAPTGIGLTALTVAPGGGLSLPQVPVLPGAIYGSTAGGSGAPSSPSGQGAAPGSRPQSSPGTVAADPGYSSSLPYGAGSSASTLPGTDAAALSESGPTRPDVNTIATFALGVLILALAAHLLYLRGRVVQQR